MPKSVARSKTRKSVAKRFKITAKGKILRGRSSRRHLLSAKNAKRKRRLGKAARVHDTDAARVKANLPFS
ncbi:MAG: 50S ribosomal protein L35 [Alphaproteobacteria bacterium]